VTALDSILAGLADVRPSAYGSLRVHGERRYLGGDYGRSWYATCPAHADGTRGCLSETAGRLRWQCDQGCTWATFLWWLRTPKRLSAPHAAMRAEARARLNTNPADATARHVLKLVNEVADAA
jgi:hypothetical protein